MSKIYKNKLKKTTIFFVLFFSLVILSLGVVSAADYGDIRDQVNGASSGDTINLGSNTYNSDGSRVSVIGKNLTIRGSSNSNRATLNGGDISGAFHIDGDSVVILRYINFVGASSPRFHAVSSYGKLTVENCTFTSCNGDSGAAIYLRENSTGSMIINSRFINNKADNDGDNDYTAGGAICIHGTDNVEIRGCYFSGNSALDSGGAIVIRNNAQNTKIISCEFVNNQAPNGGAIYNQIASTIITGCTFTNNKASNIGGAIYSISLLNITGSIFNSNDAKNGGAVYSTNSLRVAGSNFVSNSAENGGAIYSITGISIGSSSFNKNSAKNNGGAIFLSGSSRSTIGGSSKFTSNSAKNGGAIYSSSPLAISSSSFSSNKASSNGGGIYSRNGLNISKSTISKNSATYGSGVYSSNTLRVDSSTLSSNTAKFIKIVISAPNSAKSGSNVAIKAGLVYGDNVAGSFYTTNGNVFVNGKKSTVSNYSPDKKITLKFNGKSRSGSSGSSGIATFTVNVKVSKTTNYKATVSSKQGSKTFSTSKNIKFTTVKSTGKTVSKSTSSSSSVVKASASGTKKTNGNVVLPSSKTTNNPSKGIREIYNPSKKKWVDAKGKTYSSNPDKKFRIKTKYTKKTVKYQFVSKMQTTKKPTKPNKSTTITTKTYKKDNKIIKRTITVKVYYKYQYLKNPYLSTSTGCEVDSKTIKNLAKKFKKYKNKYTRANAIYKYVRKYVVYNKHLPNTAVGAWKKKKTNCVGFANLINAISRASGIPAKYEMKARSNNKKTGEGTHEGHVWSLLYINGKWVKADGTIKVNTNGKLNKKATANLKIGELTDWDSYKTVKGGHKKTVNQICDDFYPTCTDKIGKNGFHIDSKIWFCDVNCNGWK